MSVANYVREGDVGYVVIDKPPVNLFDRELTGAISDAVGEAAADGVRALLFRAEGKLFTGGVDVEVFDDLGEERAREFAAELLALTHRIEDLPFPTIAVVHGLCLTAGFELALACDMIWASEKAKFGLVEIVVGVTPFMGGTQRIAERAGPARARELVMSGDLYPAATLESWNVINRVLPAERLGGEAAEFADRLAGGPTRANAATKSIVRAQLEHGTRGADERTPDIAAELFETEDLKAAVKTFLAEGPGKATFMGR